jgi:hypothetical protein
MKEIIEVFRMSELSHDTRINVITKLGRALNYEHAANWTDDIIDELVGILQKQKQDEVKYREEMAKAKF